MRGKDVGAKCRKLWPEEDYGCASSLIRHNARRIILVGGLPRSDQDDTEQRLLIELWRKRPQFDSRRGPWCVFASVVVCNAATKILREQFAERRNIRRTASLNQRVRCDVDSVEYSDIVDCDGRRANDHEDSQRQTDLAMDIEVLVREFPHEWQTVVQLLSTKSFAEVAMEMNIPKVVLRGIVHQIRKRFEKGKMHEYF